MSVSVSWAVLGSGREEDNEPVVHCFAHAGSLQLRSVQLPRLTTPEERQRPLLRQKAPEPQQALSAALGLQGMSEVSVLPSGNQQLRWAVVWARREASSRRREVVVDRPMVCVAQIARVVKEEAAVCSAAAHLRDVLSVRGRRKAAVDGKEMKENAKERVGSSTRAEQLTSSIHASPRPRLKRAQAPSPGLCPGRRGRLQLCRRHHQPTAYVPRAGAMEEAEMKVNAKLDERCLQKGPRKAGGEVGVGDRH